ncbi:MAG: hypothetical protein KAS17_11160, partial [Victivallaceae bacterium]|nr:hypothetical protein [Victivallaceae bacterium]
MQKKTEITSQNTAEITVSNVDMNLLRQKVVDYMEARRINDAGVGVYYYSKNSTKPTLYSSSYAAMTYSLFGNMDAFSKE